MKNNGTKIVLGENLPSNTKILSGRDVGEAARKYFHLDEKDLLDEIITVNIPEKIWTVSASYFLGCFGKSIRHFGEEKFREKYIFDCSDIFYENIEDGIARALHTTGDI